MITYCIIQYKNSEVNMILSIKPKPFLLALLILAVSLASSFALYSFVSAKSTADVRFDYTIALDAGHGSPDGGCVGDSTGITEAELNLVIVKKLQKYLTNFGFKVILTRTTGDSLVNNDDDNSKRADMEKRAQIIDENNCDMVVSIHMNYFPSPDVYGAQCFYTTQNEDSKLLSQAIQAQLNSQIQPDHPKTEQIGDYYMLDVLKLPATIVECGFLSNPNEEQILQDNDYQNQITYAIFTGIVSYFSINHQIY